MAIPDKFLEELESRCDIADVVGDYVQLTKKSGHNLFGLCPFHSEKTPSFCVSTDKQFYHCFGCGKGGGVINFIMDIENLPFVDAVSFLAKRAGLEMPDDENDSEAKNRRTRLLSLNRDAARFFYNNLSTPGGQECVRYISNRGISKQMVKRFGLGAAPDRWDLLSNAMLKKGYSEEELLAAGLARQRKTGGVYDVFRNRLIFPVIDVRGSVIGFSGRILGDGEPKYLNSPDTPVFNKSKNLFALNLAKKTKRDYLILAEGNVDVISLHQAGFDCAVASLGTSLTPDQARLMSRYTNGIVIAYDSDAAGTKAAKRAIGIFEKTGLDVRILRMEGAKDPDEYIMKFGRDAFEHLLDKSENHIEYQLLSLKRKYDLDTNDGKIDFLNEATVLLANVSNSIEREIYTERAASEAGISPESVKLEVQKAIKRQRFSEKKKEERAQLRPIEASQPKDRSIRYENAASAAAEEGVIRLLMLDSALLDEAGGLSADDFTSDFLRKTFELIKAKYNDGAGITPSVMASSLSSAEMAQLTEIMQKPEAMKNSSLAMHDYIEKIKTEKLKLTAKNDLISVRDKFKDKKGYGG